MTPDASVTADADVTADAPVEVPQPCATPTTPPPEPVYARCAHPFFPSGRRGLQSLSPYQGRMVVADLDGDGILDAVSSQGDAVLVYGGLVGARFAEPVAYSFTGTEVWRVRVGDLDGDGDIDIAAHARRNIGPSPIELLFNDGDGTFVVGDAVVPAVGGEPALGDVDGDGDLDIVMPDGYANSVTIAPNIGAGTFGTQQTLPTYDMPFVAAVGDVAGDARADLVLAHDDYTVTILFGTANGFVSSAPLSTGVRATAILVRDLDGDGRRDLVVTGDSVTGNGAVSVLLSSPTGLSSATTYPVAGRPDEIAIGDLDEDGELDLLVANWTRASAPDSPRGASFLHGNGDGTFAGQQLRDLGNATSVAIADLDGDGHLDAISSIDQPYVTLGLGNGEFRLPQVIAEGRFAHVMTRDLDGDGTLELVASGVGGVRAFSIEQGVVTDRAGYGSFGLNTDVSLADLDNHPPLDAVIGVSVPYSFGKVEVSLAADSAPRVDSSYATLGGNPVSIATADVTGDCHPDIVVANQSYVNHSLTWPGSTDVIATTGPGTFGGATSVGPEASLVRLADVNADGWPDLFAQEGQNVTLRLGRGVPLFGPPTIVGGGVLATVRDMDGDGIVDLVAGGISRGHGDGTFDPPIGPTPATATSTIVDFDGDGDLDIVNADALWLGSPGGTFTQAMKFWPAIAQAVGDFNADGRADLAFSYGGESLDISYQLCLP